ncbi:SHOCT domain-containing protein [Nocardioides sp. GY 10113]|uniref:SHOCT domain-containing protein n=1 Tax=Nocardioides sp. GY 10113 TaxID=2569761 RepID=UPI0010A84F7C|nr:SHOCT domain-containing protein [Nocardioides sp. GY 10113]TIC83843.1 SHOCT domain-containing protein [Nocardioides sp. GY 10113]
MSIAEELRRIADLHAAGSLDDEEFAAAKEHILRSNGAPGPTERGVSSPADPAPGGATSGVVSSKRTRIALAASATLLVAAGAGVATVLATDDSTPTGSQARPAQAGSGTSGDGRADALGSENAEQALEEEMSAEGPGMYDGDVTILDSGFTRMFGGAVASWGVTLDNPTEYFPNAEITVEVLDGDGAISDSYSVDVSLKPNSVTPVGGYVPLDPFAGDLGFSVDFDTYDEVDGEYFIDSEWSATGAILGRDTNADLTITAGSSEGVGELCPIYLVFRDSADNIVGGATIEDHPNIPAGVSKTFKKYLIDDLFVPKSAETFEGYPDSTACW